VTDFREARCRQFDETTCSRGGYCNFMHIKRPSKWLQKDIERQNRKRAERAKRGSRSRSKSPQKAEADRPNDEGAPPSEAPAPP